MSDDPTTSPEYDDFTKDGYDSFAMYDEFGDDLSDIALEIRILRDSEARLKAEVSRLTAEVERLRAIPDQGRGLFVVRAGWRGACAEVNRRMAEKETT